MSGTLVFPELKCYDSSLSYFLLCTGARILVMTSWHAMALFSAPDESFLRLDPKKEQPSLQSTVYCLAVNQHL